MINYFSDESVILKRPISDADIAIAVKWCKEHPGKVYLIENKEENFEFKYEAYQART